MEASFRIFILTTVLLMASLFSFSQAKPSLVVKAGKDLTYGCYSPDAKLFAASAGKELILWEGGSDKLYKKIRIERDIKHFTFSSDSKYIIAACGKDLEMVKIESGRSERKLSGHESSIRYVSCAPDNKYIVSAAGNTIKVWDTNAGTCLSTYTDHLKDIKCMAISIDNKLLASAGDDEFIFIRELSGGKILQKIPVQGAICGLTFSPDNKTLAFGGTSKKISLYDFQNGSRIKDLNIHKKWIHSLEFSPDGKYLLSAAGDYTVKITNMSTGLVTIEYADLMRMPDIPVMATFSPDGKSISSVMYEVKKVNIYDAKMLGIAPKMFFHNASDKNPPQLLITSPVGIKDNKVEVYDDVATLSGNALDETGIHKIWINGAEANFYSNGDFQVNLRLAMGDNPVKVEASDLMNNISVKKLNIVRKENTGELSFKIEDAKNYLLLIGIDKYRYWPQLTNAVKDINDVRGVLTSKYKFDSTLVTIIYNEDATINNIYSALRELVEKITPNDNVMIYYSGHGYYDPLLKEGYWIPVDADKNAFGQYLSNTSLMNILAKINSRHTFLVADACFSGALFNESSRGYVENVEQFKSRWGLTSGRLEFVSDGQSGNNSPFTTYFLKYLKENTKDRFPVSDLIQYVKVNVADNATQTPIGNPLKNIGDEGGEFIFYKK